jgi:phage tail sheath protein FI
MPEYLHPGVYIEETSFRAKPIEGVSTSTAGLVGRARKGPEGRPTLVTSFTEFVRTFGQPYPAPTQLGDYLGHAVRAFFENGGRRAYVVRALAGDAQPADADTAHRLGLGMVSRLKSTGTAIGPTRTLSLDSVRNLVGGGTQAVEVWTRPTGAAPPAMIHADTVDTVDPARNTITLTGGLGTGVVLNPNAVFVVAPAIAPGGGAYVDGPIARATSRGAGGNDIAIETRPRDGTPARIAARRIVRDRPLVAQFGAGHPGPAAGSPDISLHADEARHLRTGDTITIGGSARTVGAITNGTITFTAAIAPVPAGTTVRLVRRGATNAPAPQPVLYRLRPTESIPAGTTVAVPHGLAASVRPGDELDLGGVPATIAGGAASVAVAEPAVVAITPAASAGMEAAMVRLERTAVSGGSTRLVVGDLNGLVEPYRTPAYEPIAVLGPAGADRALLQLVDRETRQIYVTSADPPAAGQFPEDVTNEDWTGVELLEVVGAGVTRLPVATTAGFYEGAIVEIDTGLAKHSAIVTAVDAANRAIEVDPAPGAITVDPDPAARGAFARVAEMDLLVYEREANGALALRESFTNLTWNPEPSTASFARYYLARLNDTELGSRLVHFDPPPGLPPAPSITNQPTTDIGFPVFLTGGDDGSALAAVDLIGQDNGPNQRTGIQALGERRDIALVAVPGVTEEIVQQALITHCELLRYRFAVLDGRPGQPVVTDILAHRNNYDSKYAGYYGPWLTTVDLTTGRTLLVPPSGHVLGICARVDNERGVHKAPANETVRGILGVELPFTDGEQDVLNPVGVNLTREMEGRGIRVWGARTISSDPEWKYVNVRRLFIFLEHSIDNGTQWVVFEPNNEALWARVKATIESFLFGVWKTGALMGTKPEDAFFVRCDRTTMTQDDIDNGRLVCLVGVAPTYPAEFVIFRIGQFTASSNLA